MKKTESSAAKTASADSAGDLNTQLTANWSEMMERSSQACAKIFGAVHEEMVGFTGKRLQADLDLMRDFYRCRNWTEMLELQQNWLKRTMESYADENTRLMDLCREAAEAEVASGAPEAKAEVKSEARAEPRQEARHDIRRAA